MITKKFTASDATWGGRTINACDLPEGVAFRLIPRDGLAAYPRSVEVNGTRGRTLVDIVDSSWFRAPGLKSIKINAAPMPLADVWATLSAITPTGFDKSNPPVEQWTVQIAEDECDLVAPAPQLPRSQVLWTVDSPKIPTNANHDVVSPLFDTSPWRSVLVSLFTTDETAEIHVTGFMDVTAAGSGIDADLVIGNLASLGTHDLVTGAAAPSQPSQRALLLTNEFQPVGQSTFKTESDVLLPFVFNWHDYFGTHDVRITYRGYR